MKKTLFILAVMLLGYAAFAQNTDALVKNYISVKNALVNSDAKTASEAIKTFYQSVSSEKNFAQKADLLKATETLNNASDLKGQRGVFNEVSTAMWAVVKSTEKVNQALYYQYCPMAKGYWLSTEKKIENPYYGSSMLSCGKVVETKE
ncbi:MAG: hypothetical protein B6D37_14335 [Sphingobacteriales bacterium UTBCD1]|jgi:hypothetical protein|nr:MAG: hypothetical protein B6D37_14335 [Sphingobacteriales bacterium UTBCD1]